MKKLFGKLIVNKPSFTVYVTETTMIFFINTEVARGLNDRLSEQNAREVRETIPPISNENWCSVSA